MYFELCLDLEDRRAGKKVNQIGQRQRDADEALDFCGQVHSSW